MQPQRGPNPSLSVERVDELAAELARLRSRVETAEAICAIQALKARYGQLVDRRYRGGRTVAPDELARLADAIAALFTADAVWDGGPVLGRVEGRPAIAARMRSTTLSFSRHFFLNPEITVDGDRARARWDLLAPCATAAGEARWMCGAEDDTYRCDGDGRWRMSSMTLTPVFFATAADGWGSITG